MTLDQIKAHNTVAQTLKNNREYYASVKLHLKEAYFNAHITRHPEHDRADADAIAEEAAERFLNTFTR